MSIFLWRVNFLCTLLLGHSVATNKITLVHKSLIYGNETMDTRIQYATDDQNRGLPLVRLSQIANSLCDKAWPFRAISERIVVDYGTHCPIPIFASGTDARTTEHKLISAMS